WPRRCAVTRRWTRGSSSPDGRRFAGTHHGRRSVCWSKTPLIPAHSASLRAFTPVFDGLWTRVNPLMAGIQGQALGPRNGGPPTRASRGGPRGGERGRGSFGANENLPPFYPSWPTSARIPFGGKWVRSTGRFGGVG